MSGSADYIDIDPSLHLEDVRLAGDEGERHLAPGEDPGHRAGPHLLPEAPQQVVEQHLHLRLDEVVPNALSGTEFSGFMHTEVVHNILLLSGFLDVLGCLFFFASK